MPLKISSMRLTPSYSPCGSFRLLCSELRQETHASSSFETAVAERCVKTHGALCMEEGLAVMHPFPAQLSSARRMLLASGIRVSLAELSKKEHFLVFSGGGVYTGYDVVLCN